jgi:hypothetical protein
MDNLSFEINLGGSFSFFAILNFMMSFKSVAKIRAERGNIRAEKKQNLLSKTIEKINLNLPQNGFILNSS